MIKKTPQILVPFLLCSVLISTAYVSFAQTEPSQEEQLRKTYNDYKANYESFCDISAQEKLSEQYNDMMKRSGYYHDLGKKLEEQGRMKEAELMYKKAYKIISHGAPKRYIWKTNAEFKNKAKIYRYRSRVSLRKKEAELNSVLKNENNCMAKLEKWITIQERKNNGKEPEINAHAEERINALISAAETLSAEGSLEKSISNYRKAFRLSKNIDKKRSLAEKIRAVFDRDIAKKTELIEQIDTMNSSGNDHYKYHNYEKAYYCYKNAYDLMLTPAKQPGTVSMKMPSLP